MTSAIRVEVRRGKNESSIALIRRFSRRAKDLSIVQRMRRQRYHARLKSKNVERQKTLVTLARRAHYHELVKLGKIDPSARRDRHHRR